MTTPDPTLAARLDEVNAKIDKLFGTDALIMRAIFAAAGDLPTLNDGEFKAGFETAIQEMGARGDAFAGDGQHTLLTMAEQFIDFVNGNACMIVAPHSQLITTAEADARVKAAVLAEHNRCVDAIKNARVRNTKIGSVEWALACEMIAAIRARGVTG